MIILRKRMAASRSGRMLLPALLFLALATLTTMATGVRAAETFRVEGVDLMPVDEVYVLGSVRVELSQGDSPELRIQGNKQDFEVPPFFIKEGSLVLGRSLKHSHSSDSYGDLSFRVVLPALQELHLKGSGDVYVKPFELYDRGHGGPPTIAVEGSGDIKLYGLKGVAVELRVKGSGSIKAMDVDVEELEAVVAGSGDLFIQSVQAEDGEFVVTGTGDIGVMDGGFVKELEVNVVGSGDARLEKVDCDVAEVNVVGSGSAEIGVVATKLNASVLGSGDVFYRGEPQVDSVELGSGEVRSRD